ncbi:hypothetical protein Ddc_00971 [Ditylenchus destructor]|nr:hypothetical protein Ddc_00971 [Ditylenchus destructor]
MGQPRLYARAEGSKDKQEGLFAVALSRVVALVVLPHLVETEANRASEYITSPIPEPAPDIQKASSMDFGIMLGCGDNKAVGTHKDKHCQLPTNMPPGGEDIIPLG